ncbi:MAG: ABC transporter ATP-binding protein/permease [Chitinophagaceae bacterium]|nr:ABC transporter ATP-binding protein/permease [Chitinophagaceae bacterium]
MKKRKNTIIALVRPYRGLILLLLIFTLLSNFAELLIIKSISGSIDDYINNVFNLKAVVIKCTVVILAIFLFIYLRGLIQTYLSELAARDIRSMLMNKISEQTSGFVETITPIKLLSNIMSDVGSIKYFISQTIVTIASSLFIIFGASGLMFGINWKLTLFVLAVIPIIGTVYIIVLGKVKILFKKSKTAFDVLNQIVNESVLGAALIRVVNSQQLESRKVFKASTNIKNIESSILNLFSLLIPMIRFTGNVAGLSILIIGGRMVIIGELSLGDFAAFNSYLGMIILPIFTLGNMGNVTAQAITCYERIEDIMKASVPATEVSVPKKIFEEIELEGVTVEYNRKAVLKDVSLNIKANSKVAIIGPTTAGKTQLLYLIAGFIRPTVGKIKFNRQTVNSHELGFFNDQIGFVFQDSFIFNCSIRENIAFHEKITDDEFMKAIDTAELKTFIESLPNTSETIISERGSSLSGGQKQRIMLARALASNPNLLLLDDFISRVDINTSKKILNNIQQNYPGLTIVSVAQKIDAVEEYDQIILLMQGELIVAGRHEELMRTNAEYEKLHNLQRSTQSYEV